MRVSKKLNSNVNNFIVVLHRDWMGFSIVGLHVFVAYKSAAGIFKKLVYVSITVEHTQIQPREATIETSNY